MSRDLQVRPGVCIPSAELQFRFSRSSGPGGQNVNKVESKVELSFDVSSSASLNDRQRAQLRRTLADRLDADGVLRVTAQISRSQWSNREEALEKLGALLRAGLTPVKRRVPTGPSRASKERRLVAKKHRSATKKHRRSDPE